MASGPPPSQPLQGNPNAEPAPVPPKPSQTQFLISAAFTIASNLNEFQKSWQSCGSNNVCRLEKSILFISIIFGVSKPLLMISDGLENLINYQWRKLKGEILIRKNSGWTTTMQFFAIYAMLEQSLSKGWAWIRYATDCLKKDRCENDDALVWITNMKIHYCGQSSNFGDEQLVECNTDTNRQNCKVVDDDGNSLDAGSATCVTFFNKLPLLFAGIIIWTLYFQLDNIVAFIGKLPFGNGKPGPGTPPNGAVTDGKKDENNANQQKAGDGQGQDKANPTGDIAKGPADGNSSASSPNPNPGSAHKDSVSKTGSKNSGQEKGSGDGPNNPGNTKGNESGTGGGKKNHPNVGNDNEDKSAEKSPPKTNKEKECERPEGKGESPSNRPPTQYLDVSCSLCPRQYSGCFPDPLPMCCGSCSNTDPKDEPNSSQNPTSKEPDSNASADSSTSKEPDPTASADSSTSSPSDTPPATPSTDTPFKNAVAINCRSIFSTQLPRNSNPCCSFTEQSEIKQTEQKHPDSDLDSSDEELLDLILSLGDEWEAEINLELKLCLDFNNVPHHHEDLSLYSLPLRPSRNSV